MARRPATQLVEATPARRSATRTIEADLTAGMPINLIMEADPIIMRRTESQNDASLSMCLLWMKFH
jgi:hypothetical protein